jgi:quercetin dioxygenase-like cupin family protein
VSAIYLTKDGSFEDYKQYISNGAKGVFRRRLLNRDNSSKQFALRAYIIKPGGYTPLDTHEHEHGVYIMNGTVKLTVNNSEIDLKAGDVIHIASNEPHQFRNESSEIVKFLCIRDYPIS